MGFHTFVATEVLTASNVMTYLMKQAVITCTSATRPTSPVQGMSIYQTDTDSYKYWNGTIWDVFPGGLVTSSTGANSVVSSGATEVLGAGAGLTLSSVSLSSSRQYRVEWYGAMYANGAGQCTFRVHVSTGAVTTGSPTVLEGRNNVTVVGLAGGFTGTWSALWTPASTGTWNLVLGAIGNVTPTNTTCGPASNNPILAIYGA